MGEDERGRAVAGDRRARRPAVRPWRKLRRKPPDFALFLTAAILLGIGVVMVFSSSYVKADRLYGDPYYYLKRQVAWAGVGLVAMLVALNLDYWHLRRWARPILVLGIVLLVMVLVPGVGRAAGGARRWLGFGPVSFQPSEFMKLAVVIWLSASLTARGARLRQFSQGTLPYMVLLALIFGLVLLQPDLGTAVAIGGTSFLLLFCAGVPVVHLLAAGGIGLVGVAWAIVTEEYRLRRFLAFLDPFADPLGSGFHIIQALYAIGSGGLFGLGLGNSRQKFFYLPEQHTDFIFAILSEELGFIGGVTVLGLYFFLAWRGFRIALAAPDTFSTLLAAGVTGMLILQIIVNIGVVTATLPITGIPLPLLSFGGSSLVFSLAGIGILMNISRYQTQ